MPLFAKPSESQESPTTEDAQPRKLALVLSGGGPRGALQVGALRALMEEEIVPDFLVGTSIGAINGAFLARYGYSLETLDKMIDDWDSSARGDFAPGDFILAMLRSMLLGIKSNSYLEQARAFYARHGITPDLRFRDLTGPRLYIVATDLKHYRPAIFGEDPDDPVLDSMLASAAIPPWIPPFSIGERLLIDGGAVSDVPIEPALRHGATEIIALDLFNPPLDTTNMKGVTGVLNRVIATMENRHIELELELARLKGVTVHRWKLKYEQHIPMWDLSHTHNLIHVGYETAKAYLADETKRLEEAEALAAASRPSPLMRQWEAWLERARELMPGRHRK